MHAVDARPIGVCTGLIISLPSYALVQIQGFKPPLQLQV